MSVEEEKSWLPFVLGPEFAMARIPAPVNLRSGWISSSLWSFTHAAHIRVSFGDLEWVACLGFAYNF